MQRQTLHQTVVNLNESPKVAHHCANKPPAGSRIDAAMGDGHGNTRKSFCFLSMLAIYRLSKKDYEQFCNLEKTVVKTLRTTPRIGDTTKLQLDALADIIQSKPESYDCLRRAILMGDDTGDRNGLDLLTLLLYRQLNHTGIMYDVLFSNHGAELVMAYEAIVNNPDAPFAARCLSASCAPSMLDMNKLIAAYPEYKPIILKLIKKHYLPKLKLITYTLTETSLHLYTHAPSGLQAIAKLANKLGVEYKDHTAEAIAHTIDEINHVFQENYVKKNRVTELFIKNGNHRELDVLGDFVWCRDFHLLDMPPFLPDGTPMNYICGHETSEKIKSTRVCQMNNCLGIGADNAYDYGLFQIYTATHTPDIARTHQRSIILNDSPDYSPISALLSQYDLPSDPLIQSMKDKNIDTNKVQALLHIMMRLAALNQHGHNTYYLNEDTLDALCNIENDDWLTSLHFILDFAEHDFPLFSLTIQLLQKENGHRFFSKHYHAMRETHVDSFTLFEKIKNSRALAILMQNFKNDPDMMDCTVDELAFELLKNIIKINTVFLEKRLALTKEHIQSLVDNPTNVNNIVTLYEKIAGTLAAQTVTSLAPMQILGRLLNCRDSDYLPHLNNMLSQIIRWHKKMGPLKKGDLDFLINNFDRDHDTHAIYDCVAQHWPAGEEEDPRNTIFSYTRVIAHYHIRQAPIALEQIPSMLSLLAHFAEADFALGEHDYAFLIQQHDNQERLLSVYENMKNHATSPGIVFQLIRAFVKYNLFKQYEEILAGLDTTSYQTLIKALEDIFRHAKTHDELRQLLMMIYQNAQHSLTNTNFTPRVGGQLVFFKSMKQPPTITSSPSVDSVKNMSNTS